MFSNTHQISRGNPNDQIDSPNRLNSGEVVAAAQQRVLDRAEAHTATSTATNETLRAKTSKEGTAAQVTATAAQEIDKHLGEQRWAGNLSWAQHGAARDALMAEAANLARSAAAVSEEKALKEEATRSKTSAHAAGEDQGLFAAVNRFNYNSPNPHQQGLAQLGEKLKNAVAPNKDPYNEQIALTA
jgi:hypothetical protein